jgi:hypothetical protein
MRTPDRPTAARRWRGGAAIPVRDARYAPNAPVLVRPPDDTNGRGPAVLNRGEQLEKLHAPIIFITGGANDSGHPSAKMNFEAIEHVPVVHAYQKVGHYPATYRQPNGVAFAQAAASWLKWQLKGDNTARLMFAGSSCGLCIDPRWTIERKKLDR